MSGEAGPDLVISALRTHAGALRAEADALEAAGQKGTSADLGIETYGIIGQFFSVAARVKIAAMGEAISVVGAGLGGLGDGVAAAADLFEDTEETNTSGLGGGR